MMFKFNNHYVSRTLVKLLTVEAFVLIMSVYLGASIRFFDPAGPLISTHHDLFTEACVFTFLMLFSMSVMGMYELNYREGLSYTLLRLMPSLLLGFGLTALALYLLPELQFGRGILVIVMAIAAFGIALTRILFYKWSSFASQQSQILILGVGELAKDCNLVATHYASHKFNVIGFVPIGNEECVVPSSAVLPMKGSLASMAKRNGAREIVVAVENRRGGTFPIQQLLECKLNGIKVSDLASFFERELFQIRVDSLHPSWLVYGDGFNQGDLRTSIKRVFDLFASLLLFVVTLPIMLITALFIFIEDGAPIFYQQERVGKGGHPFMVLKFRSMRKDAEKQGAPQWAGENDPRTTKIGRIIRKLRIDELPQIINVLKGDMSFVGPRPERPYFVQHLSKQIPYYDARHTVKPGITGWAQVRYQYGASVEDALRKLQYDLYYVKNNSLFLDVIILLETVRVVLLGKGGR